MRTAQPATRRAQSPAEERANCASHAAALVAAIVGTPFLVAEAVRRGDPEFTIGATVFCAAMILLYAASSTYHALPAGRAKRVCFQLDHVAILLLIAATYTPFTLVVLPAAAGWPLFAAVWLLALAGIGLRLSGRGQHPALTTGLYLAMGWVVLFELDALIAAVAPAGMAWLVAGGLFYTAGVLFFLTDARVRYGHAVWHTFVAAGTTCHYFAVLWYAE